ncbi:MAG: hypothetical protein FJ225_10765 [Lentisphaerae bacterium]|nr:hypothetical protein [Lentisphaerota bacterium]
MRTQDELDLARDVRRIMVKHWIDLGRLSIRCHGGRLMIYGLLQRIAGVHEPLTTPIVEGIFYQVRRVKGVRTVSAHLENWSEAGGMWHPAEGVAGREPSAATTSPGPAKEAPARSFTMTVKERAASP